MGKPFDFAADAKARWKKVPLAERRRRMEELTRIRSARAEARKLTEAIDLVKAAGYELKDKG